MIDSGAYSAWSQKNPIDIDEYITFIHTLLKKTQGKDIIYVNLDVLDDHNGCKSYANYRIMRDAGLHPIPVFHAISKPKWLEKYLEDTDFIAIGAIAKMGSLVRKLSLDSIWNRYLLDADGMPVCKVHGMGITSFPLMKRYPWYSIDSTSWLQAGMYGKVFLPRRRNGEWVYTTNPRVLSFSNQSPSVKEKGKHFDNVSPHERRLLKKYLEETGYKEGVSRHHKKKSIIEKGLFNGEAQEVVDYKEEEVVEPGVYNRWEPRVFLNALYFARFVAALPWPRPFDGSIPVGVGDA
jgi:hypothetical protein